MTAQSVLDRVREHLCDAGKVRWTDATLIAYLGHAVRRVYERRPDLLLTDSGLKTVTVPSALSGTVDLPDSFGESLEWLVAGRALAQDTDDTSSLERATAYLARGEELI